MVLQVNYGALIIIKSIKFSYKFLSLLFLPARMSVIFILIYKISLYQQKDTQCLSCVLQVQILFLVSCLTLLVIMTFLYTSKVLCAHIPPSFPF